MNDRISVIIPVYNSESSIEKCVSSVMNGSYSNLELLLVDDGSTDNTGMICDKLSRKYKDVHVLHQENRGVSAARNKGIELASGDLIAFIDSDDFVSADYLEELHATLSKQNAELAIGSVVYIKGEEQTTNCIDDCIIRMDNPNDTDRKKFLELNHLFLLYGPCNKLYYRSILQQNEIFFPEDVSYGEDLLFNLEYLKKCKTIAYRHTPYYYYVRDNSGSLSQKYRKNMFENGLRINLALIQTFQDLNMMSAQAEKYLYRRIIDDAYNSLFAAWSANFKGTFLDRVRRTRTVMVNDYVQYALQKGDLEGYAPRYISLIRGKRYWMFSLIRFLLGLGGK